MLDVVERNAPSAETINEVMIGRTLVAENAIAAVELAMELAGGAGFYRSNGLERRFRDIQGARFHPLQPGPQAEYAGAMALGLPDGEHLLTLDVASAAGVATRHASAASPLSTAGRRGGRLRGRTGRKAPCVMQMRTSRRKRLSQVTAKPSGASPDWTGEMRASTSFGSTVL